ncbi:MAG: hypothetical protein ACM3JB_16475 [Acidobacteriaceae bacterium]
MNTKLEIVKDQPRTLRGFQAVLFPLSGKRIALFVAFPEIGQEAFFELLKLVRPAYCLEMRSIPTFDLELLNRRKMFAAFDDAECKYLDFVDSTIPPVQDPEFWSILSSSRQKLHNALGPILFLVDQSYTPTVREKVLRELAKESESWSCYEATRSRQLVPVAP